MHLTDRQLDRFFDLLDGLIIFANERLHLVDGLRLPIVGDETEMKAAYVCDSLWRHVEVIDEYVRLNPRHLNASNLQVISSWRDVLVGKFTLVRFERGRAILMGDAGMFAVAGLDDDPEKRLTTCPDMVLAALLPFEGVIISDGLMLGDGIPFNAAEMAAMEESLAKFAPAGVAWTAQEFTERARAYKDEVREREFDELMSSLELEARQARDGEKLPDGFHRGVLAGLTPEEREERVQAREQAMTSTADELRDKLVKAYASKAEPDESLEGCLVASLKRDELVNLCKALRVKHYGNKNKKGIAAMLVGPLSQAAASMRNDLLVTSPQAFDQFVRVVEAGGRIDKPIEEVSGYRFPPPMPPYLFLYQHEGALTWVIPQELRAVAAQIDLEALGYDRDRESAAICCAETMSEYYGLLTLREAYDLYCGAVVDAFALEEFIALLMRENDFDDLGFVLQEWDDDSYLMHYTVSDSHLYSIVAKRHEQDIADNMQNLFKEGFEGAVMAALQAKMLQEVKAEQDDLDQYRRHIIEVRSHTPRRPLDAAAAEGKAFDRFFELPAVVQLRAFYDAHVPDGEDDYTFGDRAVEDLVLHAIDMGNVDEYLNGLEQAGWFKCAEDERLLPRLIENAYGSLPSWEFNGWSPQEILENMSGRKVFYNARGELLHPAPTDACPCGSGKLFRDCHGA